ncbi:MAG: chemotaxis-specific protein-glutamate methyltransferase CheB [Sulfuricella denitrificans]|nr:chemotaxis-specific protein-glutamate methyltransferase CheB [Sulfuricella denitrificans]
MITEDSQVVGMLLKAIFEHEPDMQIVGQARNGREAVQMAHELKPDLITMDIRMPVMDGFEATRMIMSTDPVPIVVISSSVDDEELRTTFRAIEEGALAVIEKPRGLSHPEFDSIRRELVETVRAMAEVKVIRRRRTETARDVNIFEAAIPQRTRAYEILAIGCSTGGPQALQKIISLLPIGFPVPVVITQHISKGFVGGLATWLGGNTLLNVKVAQDGEPLRPGTIYFAADERHLTVQRGADGLMAKMTQDPPVNGFRPSATPLLKSVADACRGHAIGAILTGMGVDGAEGLLEMRRAGCHTIVQDEESCIVFGMPGAAVAIDAVDQVVRLEAMPSYLTSLVRK